MNDALCCDVVMMGYEYNTKSIGDHGGFLGQPSVRMKGRSCPPEGEATPLAEGRCHPGDAWVPHLVHQD
jgi:hypothetical protein